MTDTPKVDATSVWDQRYQAGEHVGTRASTQGHPGDYTQHPFLYRHAVAMPTTGSEDDWITDYLGRKYLTPPPGQALAIGVGMAWIEEHLVRRDFAHHITAYELSSSAIKAARERISDKDYATRLDLRTGDVLEANLPNGAYDLVFVQAAIHHFDKIDQMFQLMHRVLKPGSLLIYDEYVGPDLHMYEPEVMAILNAINACLAPGYRWDVLAQHTRQHVPIPSLEAMMQADPSEGVHASRILPLTYQYFDVIERIDYGGTVMRPFFSGILPNFNWDDPKDRTVARLIILLEQLLTKHGVLPHYHIGMVARRRERPRAALTAEEERRINYSDWPGPGKPARAGGMLGRLFGKP
jgi:ubiquinone/menaquinone biosynthesis C-methylase UbiE